MASLTLVLSTILFAALLSCSTEKSADGDKKIDPITGGKIRFQATFSILNL